MVSPTWCPAAAGKPSLPVVVAFRQLLGTCPHPAACRTTQEELHNTQCLCILSAWRFMCCCLLVLIHLIAVFSFSSFWLFPLSSPSLPSFFGTALWNTSSFNLKKLPSVKDCRVALLVACTVSSSMVPFTSCVAFWLHLLRQPAWPANNLNSSPREPCSSDRFCFI